MSSPNAPTDQQKREGTRKTTASRRLYRSSFNSQGFLEGVGVSGGRVRVSAVEGRAHTNTSLYIQIYIVNDGLPACLAGVGVREVKLHSVQQTGRGIWKGKGAGCIAASPPCSMMRCCANRLGGVGVPEYQQTQRRLLISCSYYSLW